MADATALSQLASLTVQAEGPSTGYSRDLFPHWIDQGNNCNTREVVLKRDGTGVSVGSDCYPTAGRWYSVYDGVYVDSPADVQIDHIVPLAQAWRSGAAGWTTTRRQAFANDLTDPQLIAVSGSSNQSKSDRDPAEWMPPNTSVHCIYVREWIDVKYIFGMTVDQAEHDALASILAGC
jgi:hypothetical protein